MKCFTSPPPVDEHELAPRIPRYADRHEHWQPLTNITLSSGPTVIQQPLAFTNRFYRGTWLP